MADWQWIESAVSLDTQNWLAAGDHAWLRAAWPAPSRVEYVCLSWGLARVSQMKDGRVVEKLFVWTAAVEAGRPGQVVGLFGDS